ncbi:mucin-5AC-like [Limulus polyphemus]|uniref:Mucin-5AC-like n=1 Tax=Limulus polyphemus TaxID=6850 RepID=A0ABM1BCW3_LIMPO|nr:mucin-5AC-like [Limulus polyphemus]
MGPYAFKGDQWLNFDDAEMIIQKAKFILKRGLGGAMVWTLDNDDFRGICGVEQNPLVNALRKTLFSNSIESSSKKIFAREENGGDDQVYRPPIADNEERPNRPNIQRHEVIQPHPTTESPKLRNPISTPTPPPTTDPVTPFTCTDEGFYSNKQDCRKYFWCLDSGPAELGIVPHAFTCPSGLYFSSKMEACDYPENVVCDSHPVSPVLSTPISVGQTTPQPVITTTEPPRNVENEDGNTLNNFQPGKTNSRNLADLLRLLQSIGGVDRLQNILGSESTKKVTTNNLSRKQTQQSINHQVLPEYITTQKPDRTEVTTEQFRPSITEPPTTSTTPSSTTYAPLRYQRTFSPPLYRPAILEEQHKTAYQPVDQLNNQVPRRLQYEALENSDKVFKYAEPKQQKQQNIDSNYHVNKKADLSAVYHTSARTPESEVRELPSTQAASSEKGNQSLVSDPFIYQTSFYDEDLTITEIPVLSTQGPKEESKFYLVPVRIKDGKVVRIRGQTGQGRRTRIRVRSRPIAIRTQELDNLSEDALHKRRLEVRRRPVFANNYEDAGSMGIMRLADEQKLIKETENERDYEYVAVPRNRQGRARNKPPKTTTVRITTTTTTDEPTTTTTQPPTTPRQYFRRYRLPIYQPPLQERQKHEDPSNTLDITPLDVEQTSSRLSSINRTYLRTTISPPSQSTSTTSTTTTTTPRPSTRSITTTSTTIATTTKTSRPIKRRRTTTTTTTTTPELVGPSVIANGEDIECLQRGLFRHPHDCGRFVVCAPSDTEGYFRSFVHKCPADRIFMEEIGRCTFGDKDNCQAVK